jgi:hypothetical protein
MRVFSSLRLAGSASLLTTAVLLLCLGAFLSSYSASGSELSPVLTIVGVPHAEQVANGHPIEGQYPAMLANEDEGSDQLPKNAMLLRTLVVVYFFGPALGWLVACGWIRGKPEVTSLIRCCFHCMVRLHQRRTVATLLGVFRL